MIENLHKRDFVKTGEVYLAGADPTKRKTPGAINTEGLETDTTNDLNFATGQRESKAFATLAARFALAGHTFTRSNPADGAVLYYVTRWGLSRALDDLDAARQFLARIGGGL